ncbi:hypothetical protein Nepgr_032329 [Nepenthes gracilis]|uniref:Protein TIFY n=1 Tax=Nepenthes gracilis TaxID=150966 RepID=A0AAD3TK36_NEPGR|nr:hypothetical protein Nepgr_032329 [Nepenthes gracilis]
MRSSCVSDDAWASLDDVVSMAPAAAKENVDPHGAPEYHLWNEGVNKAASSESRAAQMTIFYAGQVIVFNDFPGDKANEIIELASRGSSQKFSTSVSNSAKSTADSSNLIPPH